MPKFRILERAKRLFRRKPPCYVIVYDVPDPEDGISDTYGHVEEQYYGYFSSPEEARRVWNEFKGPGLAEETYRNVKLCRVVEEW